MADKRTKRMADKSTDALNGADDRDAVSRLRFECDILLEEYRVASGQILHRLETDEKNYDLTIITLGAIVASSSIVINLKIYNLLLILSLPFYILVWEQVRRTMIGRHLAKYVRKELAPRLNEIIQTTASSTNVFGKPLQFISWEQYGLSLFSKDRIGVAMRLPKAGKAALQFGVAIFLVGIYLYLRVYDTQYIATVFDIGLLLVNFIASIITVFSVLSLRVRKKVPVS